MKKITSWIWDNILFLFTLFLLLFIPLYPKLPLVDVKNTWVYVRAEDFVVFGVIISWIFLLIRRKVTLKTPLTIPIMVFWIIGALATIHGVVLIFPTLADVFPNVAFLSFLRHIEYMSLFFIAYSGMRNKRFLPIIIAVLVVTLLLVVVYGFGQKYLEFPAYLTMNEEFAKGLPIQLSQLSRVPSTFAGHYDLAAYLVLIIPMLASLLFGFRNWFIRLPLLISIALGFILLFMTVSRVSFFVVFVSLFFVLLFQKKKLILFVLPIIVGITLFVFLSFSSTLLDRFGNTVKEINVLVNANTGEAIGHVQNVPASYFENKIILRKTYENKNQLSKKFITEEDVLGASVSAFFPFSALPPEVVLIEPPNTPTGETLPQGTGYINLSLSPVVKRTGEFFYYNPTDPQASASVAIRFSGDFLVKKASAYDLSFTTRFQGEWPRAIAAFKRNILFGSGYGSVSLAVDNNYFRILGELGILGVTAFIAIFLVLGIYIKKTLPDVSSRLTRSFILGFAAGVIGLALNATLIDVFEASKIAFLLWILSGITLGVLALYQPKPLNIYKELKDALTSPYAIIIYLFFATIAIFSPLVNNYFVGDDFTWFRWAADCSSIRNSAGNCPQVITTIFHYFTQADGFFYRPGTKTYFFLMYSVFWLNQAVYHIVSLSLHFIIAALFFLLARKLLRSTLLSAFSAFLFLIMSGYSEVIFWTAATGYLFTTVFALASLHFFILWSEGKKIVYLLSSFIFIALGLLFHEVGVIVPFLIVLYELTQEEVFSIKKLFKKKHYLLLFSPILLYLLMRYIANSHWFSGDYSYNLTKLPLNILGNLFGYFTLALFGPISLPIYETLRNITREQILLSFIAVLVFSAAFILLRKTILKHIWGLEKDTKRILIFGLLFFTISLLPFLGLGNITSRYSYLASFGLILLFVFFIKKLYIVLQSNGKDIAAAAIGVVIASFSLLHIIQVQQLHSDWYEAGEKVRRFFISIDGLYANHWSKRPMEFHFVDVPIKTGEAWVFPVGLPDAIWFAFRNESLTVYIQPNLETALLQTGVSPFKRVFQFQENGSIKEIYRYIDIYGVQKYKIAK